MAIQGCERAGSTCSHCSIVLPNVTLMPHLGDPWENYRQVSISYLGREVRTQCQSCASSQHLQPYPASHFPTVRA